MLSHYYSVILVQIKHSVFDTKVRNQNRYKKVGLFRTDTNEHKKDTSEHKKEDDASVILSIVKSDIQIILLRELREPLLQELQLREQKPTCGCGGYGSSWQHLYP